MWGILVCCHKWGGEGEAWRGEAAWRQVGDVPHCILTPAGPFLSPPAFS